MSEPIVSFGVGFLLAVLLALGTVAIARMRARRPATPSIEPPQAPLMSVIEADMDQIHSQIAVATRRLEICVEQMKVKTTSQLAEIGSTSETIARLKAELADRNAVFATLQDKARAVTAQLNAAEASLATTSRTLQETEQKLANRKAEYQRLNEEFDIHPALAKAESRHTSEMDKLRADKELIEEQLDHSRSECGKLQDYIDSMKKQVETTWASERMANAVLRERINDVASEVVRVAAALEGLNSPIDTLLAGKAASAQAHAEETAASGEARNHHLPAVVGNGDGSSTELIHRIRALRQRSIRASATE
jgi:chromosome segregation ATPase